jgi:hypothetical protein
MSELLPSLVSLDKGLNLQTAKVVAEPGSVLDGLNYEQVDFQGQKRIDGFARYDGRLLSALNEYYKITLTSPFGGSVGDLFGSTSAVDDSDSGVCGVVVGVDSNVIYVAVINENAIPQPADLLYYLVDGAVTGSNAVTVVATGTASAASVDEHYTNLLDFSAVLREPVEELPGPVAGLHWFRDRLYAVAGVTAVSLTGTTPIIYPNDVLTLDGTDYNVLDAYVLDNTRLVFLDALNSADWQVEGTAITRDGVSVGTVANGFEDLTTDIASFFESRTEVQVLEEDGPAGPYDFGWRFKHLGWAVPFEDGTSLFGSLPALNQNIEGVGIEGPTSTTGEAGRPLILKQNVSIADYQTQVNGWKSSNTPTTYDLDPDNLADVDSLYIYADAFLSWDGTTGAIDAPGITSPTLTQYSAVATVEVEV